MKSKINFIKNSSIKELKKTSGKNNFYFNFLESINCSNYNEKKLDLVNEWYKALFSLLQISKLESIGKKAKFFMALIRIDNSVPFIEKHLEIKEKTKLILPNLRQIQETVSPVDLSIICNVISESEGLGGFDCITNKEANGASVGMELNTDNINNIGGIPDDVDFSKLNYELDYSYQNNMKFIDNLPNVEIEDIDYTDCEKDGIYIIKGKLIDGNLDNYINVEIPFGSPDSTGLCDITVYNKNVIMKCNNKEKFDISSVIFEPQVIKNFDNKEIYKLASYYYQKRFSCAMSTNSESPDNDLNNDFRFNNMSMAKKSQGLWEESLPLKSLSQQYS